MSTMTAAEAFLGTRSSASPQVVEGWLVSPVDVRGDLLAPGRTLPSGLAVGIATAAARQVDPYGAPLTRVSARLFAPPSGSFTSQAAVRPADLPGLYEVELRAEGQAVLSAQVELAGRDVPAGSFDLTELATGLGAASSAHMTSPAQCWVCTPSTESGPTQGVRLETRGSASAVGVWLPDLDLADEGGVIDPMLVPAILECPNRWLVARGSRNAGQLTEFVVLMAADLMAMEPVRLAVTIDRAEHSQFTLRSVVVAEESTLVATASMTFEVG